MPMTWETNIDRAYKIGMYMLSNKTIFDDNSKMIKELKDKCQNIRESNDSEVKKYVEDFQTVLSKFDEKNKLIETGKKYNMENGWIFDQFLKLSKANEDHNVKKQKSKILLDKISFYESSIIQINKILNFAYEKLEKYMDLNNEKIIINLKLILKSTENYNISKLKRAAEKFQQSKELGDFKFGRMNPKLAHLLSSEKEFELNGEEKIKVETPFDSIWIQKSKNKNDKSRMIYVDENCTKAPTYDEISKELDFKFSPTICQKYREYAIVNIIMPIINYIKQKLDENFEINKQNIVSSIEKWCKNGCNKANLKYLSDKQQKCAACLCVTLLFSESHEFRNPTGGKFERKAMKNVLKLAEDGCTNPFGVVFNRENGRYISGYQHGMRAGKLISQNNLKLVDIKLFIFNIIKTKLITDNPQRDKISKIIQGYNKNADKTKQLINLNKIKGDDGLDKVKRFFEIININEKANIDLKQVLYNFKVIPLAEKLTEDIKKVEKFMENKKETTLDELYKNVQLSDELKNIINKNKNKINKLINGQLSNKIINLDS